ncbi:MAG: glycosyltransferase family 9 protein [Luteolibacter sp.]
MREPERSILVHMNREPVDAMGEVFMRLPFMKALRKWAPEAEITIIPGIGGAPFWEELLAPITWPLFDHCIRDKMPDPAAKKYDLVLDMEGDAENSFFLRKFSKGRFYTCALRGMLNLPRFPCYHGKHVAEKYLGTLRQVTGAPCEPEWPWDVPEVYRRAADRLLPGGETYVGIAPGAGVQVTGKLWPTENYVALAEGQATLGRVPVIFLGTREEAWRGRFASIPGVRFPLQENLESGSGLPSDPVLTMTLASRLSVAVANCSGTGHMLATGGAPVVTLFGPSSPKKFRPLARKARLITPPAAGGTDVSTIVLGVVEKAVEEIIEIPPALI